MVKIIVSFIQKSELCKKSNWSYLTKDERLNRLPENFHSRRSIEMEHNNMALFGIANVLVEKIIIDLVHLENIELMVNTLRKKECQADKDHFENTTRMIKNYIRYRTANIQNNLISILKMSNIQTMQNFSYVTQKPFFDYIDLTENELKKREDQKKQKRLADFLKLEV